MISHSLKQNKKQPMWNKTASAAFCMLVNKKKGNHTRGCGSESFDEGYALY